MNNNDKKLNDVLEDVFGADFLEINIDPNVKEEKVVESNLADNVEIPQIKLPEANIVESTNDDTMIAIDNDKELKNIDLEDKTDILKKEDIASNNEKSDQFNKSDTKLIDNEDSDLKVSDKTTKQDFNYKKLIVYFIIGVFIGILFVYIFIIRISNEEKNTYCYYEAKDAGYKLTDEYKITYKSNKILYISGTYVYEAKNDEFKKQIEYIKEEKLPVIINSNGMPGFTHIYEQSDTVFKVDSYYDLKLFDFNKVDKNDDKTNPISYINLKSDINYKKLKSSLEKSGYKCTISK